MNYLITGGAGFIGSNIVKRLLADEHHVVVLDNFSTGKKTNIASFIHHKNFRLIEGDLRNFKVVEQAVQNIDYVLHQGALPSVPRSISDPITSNDVNISGTLNILEASRKSRVKRVVYASSSSIYGNNKAEYKKEDMPVMPMSPYALTKYSGERYCQIFYKIYGLETVCLRYFNVFGMNQDPNSEYSAVIPKFIKLIASGKRPVIYGDGLQSRDFTFVENNVDANLLACTAEAAGGEVFNIACGSNYNLLVLVDEINRVLDKKIEPVFENARPGDVKHSRADIQKAQDILGYNVKVDFKQGLEKTIGHIVETIIK